MNQTPPASDNLFLRSYAAWRAQSMKLTGKLLLLALVPLAVILLMLGVAKIQLHADTARQVDGVGTELAKQIAASLADSLAADDQLSLNIQLAQWKRNPLISHVRLYTAENRLIAEAGDQPGRGDVAPGQGQYDAVVHFQEAIVGQVQLSVAAEPFVGPANTLLWRLLWGTLLLALLAGILAWRLARSMRQTLHGLSLWQGDSGQPIPGVARRDELGDLARHLGKRRIIDMPPEPEPEPVPEDYDADSLDLPDGELEQEAAGTGTTGVIDRADRASEFPPAHPVLANGDGEGEVNGELTEEGQVGPPRSEEMTQTPVEPPAETIPEPAPAPVSGTAKTAILSVRLGNQEALKRLPRARLLTLLERYREQLQQACELYDGHVQTLHDGTSLVLFHAAECRQDELTHALCCGELLRVLGHELQVEIADTGITLHLQLAIGHSPDLTTVPAAELAELPACQSVLDAVQHSRNLLLLDATLANSSALKERAAVRRLASQPGIYCIERLHGHYQAILEQQLRHFYHQRPD